MNVCRSLRLAAQRFAFKDPSSVTETLELLPLALCALCRIRVHCTVQAKHPNCSVPSTRPVIYHCNCQMQNYYK